MPRLEITPPSVQWVQHEELDHGLCRLHLDGAKIDWVSPPEALRCFISELFASRPQDVFSWVHEAAWRLREQTWQGNVHSSGVCNMQIAVQSAPNKKASTTQASTTQAHLDAYSQTDLPLDLNLGRVRHMRPSIRERMRPGRISMPVPAPSRGSFSPSPSNFQWTHTWSKSDTPEGGHTSALPESSLLLSPPQPEPIEMVRSQVLAPQGQSPETSPQRSFDESKFGVFLPELAQLCDQTAAVTRHKSPPTLTPLYTASSSRNAHINQVQQTPMSTDGRFASPHGRAKPTGRRRTSFGSVVDKFTPGTANNVVADFLSNFRLQEKDRSGSGSTLHTITGPSTFSTIFSKSSACLSPASWTCFLWTGVFTTCLILELWIAPFVLVFWANGLPSWVDAADMLFLSVFVFDILQSLRTGYIRNGVVYTRWPRDVGCYVRSWMWLDIIATAPYVLCIASAGGRRNELARLIILLRAFRLKRVVEWMRRVRFFIPCLSASMPIIKLQLAVWLIAHSFTVLFGLMHPRHWVKDHPDGPYGCYLQSMWRASLALVLGSASDVSEGTPQHRMVWDICSSFAHLLLLLILLDWSKENSLLRFTRKLDDFSAKEIANQDQLQTYFSSRGIPPSLQIRVLQAFKETESVSVQQAKIDWFTDYNFDPRLRQELIESLWEERILTLGIMVPLVQWQNTFAAELAEFVEETILPVNTVLFWSGRPTSTAYFILKGALQVVQAPRLVPKVDYTAKMWVGEQALVNPALLHNETLCSRSRVELMGIRASDFRGLLVRMDLAEDFDSFLQQTLWMGLCGRCGVLGDHFSKDCPSLTRGSCYFGITNQSDAKVSDQREALLMFLTDYGLSHLIAEMDRHSIKSMNDLSTSAFENFLNDVGACVTYEDKESLRKVVGRLRRKAAEGAASLMSSNNSNDKPRFFIFISHFKMEAGTEATLMQRDFERLLETDPANPSNAAQIFVDSENLTSLTDLHDCVRKSQNVVVFLTPGVLQRPWVLVEIALAFRYNINMVPVEVQRPNLQFQYPDEIFLKGIGTGASLAQDCLEVLKAEGIALIDLENALRLLFKLIAAPYSPHKSAAIRDAELRDVLKRCKKPPTEEAHPKSLKRTHTAARDAETMGNSISSSGRALRTQTSSVDRDYRAMENVFSTRDFKPATVGGTGRAATQTSLLCNNSHELGDFTSQPSKPPTPKSSKLSSCANEALDRLTTQASQRSQAAILQKLNRNLGEVDLSSSPKSDCGGHALTAVVSDGAKATR